jgi:hypothetical protein
MKINDKIVNLCGRTGSHYYFSTKNISLILKTDTNLANLTKIWLRMDSATIKGLIDTLHFTTYIDSPLLTIFVQNSKAILCGNIHDPIAQSFKLSKNFNNVLRLTGESVLVKGFDSSGQNLIFRKINLRSNIQEDESNITERLNDGGFAEDGVLSADLKRGLLVYTYFYCNRISVFDTSLNMKENLNTIDTFTQYRASAIHLGTLDHPRGFTFNKPPQKTNGWSEVSDGRIYVNSLVKADNESHASFSNDSVIDVYNLLTGQYLGSFYIGRFNGEKLSRFKIIKDQFIAIYTNAVVSYSLNHRILLMR